MVVFTSQYGSITSDSQYYLLQSYSNFVQPSETTEVCILRSNPQLPDSDYDGYNDAEDAIPNETNPDAVYLLFGSEWIDHANYWERKYEDQSTVIKYECDNWEDFKNYWNSFGLVDNKYYYNIERVFLLYHGDIGVFSVGDTWVATDYRDDISSHISSLESKRINILDLKICESGTLSATNIYPETYISGTQDDYYGYNIALQFIMSFPEINSVRAWNGTYHVASNFFGHYERGILSDTEYEECCYVYSRCDAGYLIVQDNDIEITGVYNYYNPITGG